MGQCALVMFLNLETTSFLLKLGSSSFCGTRILGALRRSGADVGRVDSCFKASVERLVGIEFKCHLSLFLLLQWINLPSKWLMQRPEFFVGFHFDQINFIQQISKFELSKGKANFGTLIWAVR